MSATGYVVPLLVVGSIFATVASGLIYTFEIDSLLGCGSEIRSFWVLESD